MKTGGWHFILNRKESKGLFGAEDDDAVRTRVAELIRQKTKQEDGSTFNCGNLWDPIHRCLSDGELDPAGGEFPLNHCILGGKQLYKGDDFEAIMIRPDIVPHIAEAIHGLKRVELQEAYREIAPEDYGRELSDEEFDHVWNAIFQIRQLFEDAAENRDAVMFAVAHNID